MPVPLSPKLNEITQKVIGAAIEVHKVIGPGFLESVYEEALSVEFDLRGIPYLRQHVIGITYKNRIVGEGRLDFLVSGCVILELKAVDELHQIHSAQILSYLKTTGHPLGLLINFNDTLLTRGLKRFVLG